MDDETKARLTDSGRQGRSDLTAHVALVPMALRPSPPMMVTQVSFDAAELREILNLYGRKVADGEWRDYAIDFLREKAVFSVFRRASEMPLYRIEKDPKLARRQGAYSVVAAGGRILKRGPELARVLRALDKPLKLVAG